MRGLTPVGALALLQLAASPLVAGPPGLDPAKALTQYSLDTWTTTSGLPQNTVTSVAQTKDGYLWLGTFGGLARFDGQRVQIFDRAAVPQLRNSGILALLPGRDGGLWIGTNGGGLTRLENGTFTTYAAEDGLPGDVVRCLHEDRRGTLWVGTNRGLGRLEGGRFRSWAEKDGLTESVVRAIAEDAAGTLWVGTNGGGLCRLVGRGFECLRRKDGLPSDFVFAVLADPQGGLWVGTNGAGLARFRDGSFEDYGRPRGLAGDVIWSLYRDSAGALFVGTYGAGLFRLEGERFRALTTAQGLPSDFVRSLWQDREGSLWIATNTGGLARLRDGKFTTYTSREGLPHDVAKTVLADSSGNLWIGTSGGGLARFRDGVFTRYGLEDGLPNLFVQSLLAARDGALWIGTNGGGLARLQNGRFRTLTTRDGLGDDHVSTLAEDPDGGLWIGTNAGGLSRLKDGRFTRYTRAEGLGANLVMATLVDHRNVVWVGTDGGGLTRIEGERLRTFTTKDGLAADSVLALHEDEQGALWIGTSGGGLGRLEGDRFTSWSTREGLHEDVVFAIVDDGRGGLWLSGNRGISRIDKASLLANSRDRRQPLRIEPYGTADGMKSNECSGISQPAGARGADGKLWFPTTRGVVTIDPARIPQNALPPPVHVETLAAGGETHEAAGTLELRPGASNWEIRYTALSLVAPQRVRFKYRLFGFDEDWVDPGGRRSAFYTQVPPGAYRFQVIACNNDGIWNETGAELRVRLRPRFRETLLFRGLVGLGLVLAVAGAWVARARAHQAHRRELEQLVEARTRELRERQREADAARAGAERQREIAQEASALKTELLSIAAHDLKTPLTTILGCAEMAQLNLPPASAERGFVDQIHGSARRMLAVLTRLLDAAALESGRVSLSRRPFSLAEVTREVIEASQVAAERKQQALSLSGEGSARAVGDEERIRDVVDNLVSNAIKYSPRHARIEVHVARSGGRVRCEVVDQGPGLSEDDKGKLFGRFQRLSAKPTGGEPATGLGLSIARQIVEAHGGRIWAESDGAGRGSRFAFEIEAAE